MRDDSSSEAQVPLPVHAVNASSRYVVALTAGNILVFDAHTGERRGALDTCVESNAPIPPHMVCFPRICAISPNEKYVAIASDDKALRVWCIDDLEYGKEVFVQPLAKRAGTVHWVNDCEMVVADKFGDVWSFVIDPSQPKQVQSLADADTDVASSDAASAQGPRPKLGHVSMITCLAFLRDASSDTPSTIVTCDRDEHIRLSRWGPHRAAHIVQQYLLGSRSCVGALVVVPADRAESAGFPCSRRPVLITSDGGACLRAWCSDANGKYALQATCHFAAEAMAQFVCVDAAVERRREKAANNLAHKGGFDPQEPEPATKRAKRDDLPEEDAKAGGTSLVIHQLLYFHDGEHDWLVIRVEGAKALFTVRLDQLTSDVSAPGLPVRDACALDAPILDTSLVHEEGCIVLWVCCDDRPGMGTGPPLSKWTWDTDHFTQDAVHGDTPLHALTSIQASNTTRATVSHAVQSKLCLYSQIMTWPKPPQTNPDGTPFSSFFLSHQSDQVSRGMLDRFQSGKRAAGRAKNQASIQQQFGGS